MPPTSCTRRYRRIRAPFLTFDTFSHLFSSPAGHRYSYPCDRCDLPRIISMPLLELPAAFKLRKLTGIILRRVV